MASSNIAVAYRSLGRSRLAFNWWKKGADAGNAEDALEVAICYQHGIGVRKNQNAALRYYLQAVRAKKIIQISPYGLEEAQYLLATYLITNNCSPKNRRIAVGLLRKASAEGDYRQADTLLKAIRSKTKLRICSCRRGLKRSYGGSIGCPLHKGDGPKLS